MKAIASLLTIAFLLCGFAAITPASAQETCPLCQFAVQVPSSSSSNVGQR
jgi:hypothetical protein